jgi:predicted outer membrane repeat protein
LQSVYLVNSSFTGNGAGVQGGAIYSDYSALVINDCVFTDNYAVHQGGAVQANSCVNGSLNIYFSTFVGNQAQGSGGAIYASSCNTTVNGSTFSGNWAGVAGAVYAELSIADSDKVGQFLLYLDDVSASNNSAKAGQGGCLSSSSVNVTVTGGEWVGNSAFSGGGLISGSGGGSVVLQDVQVMSNNSAFGGSGGVVSQQKDLSEQGQAVNLLPTIT